MVYLSHSTRSSPSADKTRSGATSHSSNGTYVPFGRICSFKARATAEASPVRSRKQRPSIELERTSARRWFLETGFVVAGGRDEAVIIPSAVAEPVPSLVEQESREQDHVEAASSVGCWRSVIQSATLCGNDRKWAHNLHTSALLREYAL